VSCTDSVVLGGKKALTYVIIRLWIMHFIVSFHIYNNITSYLAHQRAYNSSDIINGCLRYDVREGRNWQSYAELETAGGDNLSLQNRQDGDLYQISNFGERNGRREGREGKRKRGDGRSINNHHFSKVQMKPECSCFHINNIDLL